MVCEDEEAERSFMASAHDQREEELHVSVSFYLVPSKI